MKTARDNAEKIKEISGTNPLKCMKCGKCSATCPSFNEMDIKPHQFVSYVVNEDIEALVNSKSLWNARNRNLQSQVLQVRRDSVLSILKNP